MALVLAAYAAPPGWERPVAAAAVVLLTAVGYRGVTRTARSPGRSSPSRSSRSRPPSWRASPGRRRAGPPSSTPTARTAAGTASCSRGAAVLRVRRVRARRDARRGGARSAPHDPARGPRGARGRGRALRGRGGDAARGARAGRARRVRLAAGRRRRRRVVDVGRAGRERRGGRRAAPALSSRLLAGVSRTGLAMARTGDLPGWFAAVHPVHRVPYRAELAVGAVVVRARAHHRPARRDRVLVVRRARLLPRREPVRAAPDDGAPAYPRALQVLGAHRVRRPRRHAAAPERRGRAVVLAVGVALRVVLASGRDARSARPSPDRPTEGRSRTHRSIWWREDGRVTRPGRTSRAPSSATGPGALARVDEVRRVDRRGRCAGVPLGVGPDAPHELLRRGMVACRRRRASGR